MSGYSTDEPCRQIKNKLADELVEIEATHTKAEAAEMLRPVAESSLKKAMMDGDMENGAVMAGQITALITEERAAAVIIDAALAQAKDILSKIGSFEF